MKKNKIIIAAVCAVLAAAIAATAISAVLKNKVYTLKDAGVESTEDLTIISHRGMNVFAPENTLEAAQKAAEFGYKQVEFDIRLSKDGVWVLMHDEDIDRTTDGKGKVSELTYKQLLECRVNSGKKELVVIPSLDEMLSLCSKLEIHPVIEIKQSGTEFIRDLLNFIGYRCGDCTIITFDRAQAEEISKHIKSGETSLFSATVDYYWLVSELSDEALEAAKADTSVGVSFNGNKSGSEEEIKRFTDAGIKLATWTIDKPKRLGELYSLGVKTITTNRITPHGIPEETTVEVEKNARD